MKTLKILILALMAGSTLLITSCNKDENEPTSNIKVKMTDFNDGKSLNNTDSLDLFSEVNVHIESVAIHYGDTNGNIVWMDLPTNSGMYNLLELDNTMVIIATGGELPVGYIGQMRLVLGNDNYVVIDSVAHDLQTPSAQQSGLKLNLNFTAEAGSTYEIVLNFDVDESIVLQGNGGFLLKPMLRVESIIAI
ncbi:MAG: DUF4382 domain-containing protein [Bacteroidales bacterium]|nr:DUF4382 domain-containing protein [Bacteroidales bacterium]